MNTITDYLKQHCIPYDYYPMDRTSDTTLVFTLHDKEYTINRSLSVFSGPDALVILEGDHSALYPTAGAMLSYISRIHRPLASIVDYLQEKGTLEYKAYLYLIIVDIHTKDLKISYDPNINRLTTTLNDVELFPYPTIDEIPQVVEELLETNTPNTSLSFKEELTTLLNKHGKDSDTDIPDYILADYLTNCIETAEKLLVWSRE